MYESVFQASEFRINFNIVVSTDFMYISQGDELILAQRVNSDMHIYFDETHQSVVWVHTAEGIVHTLSLMFHKQQDNDSFKRQMTQFLWETNTATPFAKVAVRS